MADQVSVLLAEAPGLERASRLAPSRLPVLEPFERLLPDAGLRPGSTLQITGVGATSIALALVARASQESWTAAVGLGSLGLCAAAELGIDLDHLVVVCDPAKRSTDVLAAVVDAFDVVLIGGQPCSARQLRSAPPAPRTPRPEDVHKISARVRERDAVLVVVGGWPESDLRIEGAVPTWHGIGPGHGHLAARSIDVTVTGRRAASRPRSATLWLPDHDGEVRFARDNVVRLAR